MIYVICRPTLDKTITIVESHSIKTGLYYKLETLKDKTGNGYYVEIKMSEYDLNTYESIYETGEHWYFVGNLKELMKYNDARVRATLRIFENEYLKRIKR